MGPVMPLDEAENVLAPCCTGGEIEPAGPNYICSMIAFSVTLGRIAAAHIASSGQ